MITYNQSGRIECHGCGCWSDEVYVARCYNENGEWTSNLCGHCIDKIPPRLIVSREYIRLAEVAEVDKELKVCS